MAKRKQLFEVDANNNISNTSINRANKKNTLFEVSAKGKVTSHDTSKEKNKNGFFQSGKYFDNGYDFGDISKTLFWSGADLLQDVTRGFSRTIEGTTDTLGYLSADVLDFFGADDTADWLRDVSKYDVTGKLLKPSDYLEQRSVFGNYSDTVFEGVGNVGGMIVTNTVMPGSGAASTILTSFSSAYGNSMSEALRNGQDLSTARKTAFINGTAEAISEQFFSGLPGLKTENWGGKLLGKIGSGVEKYFGTNTGKLAMKILNASGEGFEEIISNMLTSAGNDLMHKFDKNFTYGMEGQTGNILEDVKRAATSKESWNSFISAALTSALTNGGNQFISNTQKNNLIKSYAKENNMTVNQVKNMFNQSVQQKTQAEMQRKPNMDLGQRVETENMAKAKTMQELRRGTFVQPGTETQAYQYAKSENQKVNEMNQSIVDAGGNNTQANREAAATAKRLIEDLGFNIKFTNNQQLQEQGQNVNGRIINGFVKDGTMYLNLDSDELANFTIGHETKHFFEANKEMNDLLNQSLKEYAQEKGIWDKRLAETTELYTDKDGNLIGDPEGELLADLTGEVFANYEFVNNLSIKNPSLFEKVRSFFQNLYYKATGQKEKLLIKQINDNLNKVYREYAKTQPKKDISSTENQRINDKNIQYSISQELDDYLNKNKFTFDVNGNMSFENLTSKQITALASIYRKTGYSDVSSEYLKNKLSTFNGLKVPREVADRFIQQELGYKPKIDTTKVYEDAEGNSLTKEQVEFYKDSDVRDIRGRLIPVYHKTNAEFTVFDKKAGKQHGNKYGKGFYFSITPENYGNNEMKVYLNAKEGEYKYIPSQGYYVVQEPNQIKNVDNTNPTDSPDIRYSLSKDAIRDIAKELDESPSMLEANLGDTEYDAKRYLTKYTKLVDKYMKDNNIEVEPVYKSTELDKIPQELKQFIIDNDITVEKLGKNKQLLNEYLELQRKDMIDKGISENIVKGVIKQLNESYDLVDDNGKSLIPFSLKRENKQFDLIKNNTTEIIDNIETDRKIQKEVVESPKFQKYLDNLIKPLFYKESHTVEEVMEEAKDNHGVTNNWDTGAYMTTDGELLNFNDNGYRDDHRTISVFDLDMNEFMDYGAIRMKPEGNGFEMAVEPTNEQYSKLEDYIDNYLKQKGDESIFVDFDIPGTKNYDSAVYNVNTPTSKIINDIQTYYKTGKLPQKSQYADFYYSLSKEGELQSDKYKDLFPGMTRSSIHLSDLKRKEVELSTEQENALKTSENEQKQSEKPTRREVIDRNRQLAREQLGDITQIKDKKRGLLYQINTMKRNLRDIMTKEQAQKMYDTYFKDITTNNAKIENDITSYNERIQKYNLNDKESTYTQMIGELKHNPETTLTKQQVDDFYYKNANKIDQQKCENAVNEFRQIYDELIEKVNDVLTDNGYKPIEYRKGYFPHFIEEKATSKLGKLAEKLGWKVKKGQLPTDIAGITDQFKPGKAWTSFSQQRTGDATDYNALKGLDNYLRGAMDVIHHTNDIQKLRALENEIRYQYSSKGVQDKINEIYADESLDMEEKNDAIANLTSNIRESGLGNFVTEIRNYTDNLANKKAFGDRSMEQAFGRDVYSIMNNINGRVSANMVGANISSAITNFIPITQAWSQLSTKNLMRGMYESIKTSIKGDNFADRSTFLTNRTKQAEKLYNTKMDKITQKLGVPFEAIDSFTSNTIVRAKYYDNIAKGMSEQEAMSNADEFAKDVMAGRSKGDQPTIFNRKNPLFKLFTAFQLEVNNQYGYMFKDIPTNMADEAKRKLVGAFIKMFLGAWLYNEITEKFTGRRAAFDPIDMAVSDVKTLTNEDMDLGDKIQSIVKDTAQEVPFVSGLAGGGRLPIQGAIPYSNPLEMVTKTFEDIGNLDDPKKRKTAINNLKKEWSKPVYYLAFPVAGGQIKKTVEGLSMYDKDLPIAGSYTNSGKLRFEADTSTLGKVQAAVFGQYASKNAREYFKNGYTPLTEGQVEEALEAELPINEYREINQGIKDAKAEAKAKGENQTEAMYDYIYDLPIEMEQKNSLINSRTKGSSTVKDKNGYIKYVDDKGKTYWYDKKNDIVYNNKYKEMDTKDIADLTKASTQKDISNYGDYGSLAEFNYSNKNPEKYLALTKIADYDTFMEYKDELAAIKQKYDNQPTEFKKKKVFEYINSLPLSVEQKLMLQKMGAGYSIKQYRGRLHNYINNMELTKEQKQAIDKVLFD